MSKTISLTHKHKMNIIDRTVKCALLISLVITFIIGSANSKSPSTNEYDLPLYDGWSKEIISFPLGFAPEIKLSGIEELRFPPGMFNSGEQEYWSYLFVWWIDSENTISQSELEEYLEIYFLGLAKEIAGFNKTKASGSNYNVILQQVGEAEIIGSSTLVGTELNSEVPSLNIKVNQINCEVQKRRAVIFELSPKSFDHENWQVLSKLKNDFNCRK